LEKKWKLGYTNFDECVEQFKTAITNSIKKIESYSEEELRAHITGEIMNGAPKMAIVYALGDHTAHVRW